MRATPALGTVLVLAHRLEGPGSPSPRVPRPCGPRAIAAIGFASVVLVAAAGSFAGRRAGTSRLDAEAIADRATGVPWRPGRVDPWSLSELQPDPSIVRVLEPEGGDPVQLVVLSYRDVPRDASVFRHAPDRCYRTAGWEVEPLEDEALEALPASAFRAARPDESRTVVTWYQVGDRRAAGRSALWLASFRSALSEGRTDGVIVLLASRGGLAALLPIAQALR